MCQNRSGKAICRLHVILQVINFSRFSSQLFRGAGQDAGEHSRNRTRSKQTRCASNAARLHGAARTAVGYNTRSKELLFSFISAILQTALNIKGYPHLPVSFHRRLQVYI